MAGAEAKAPEPDDLARPVSLRMLSAFNRLRGALPEPHGVVMALQGLGFALVPGPAEDRPRSTIAGMSMDSLLGVVATIEDQPERIAVAVSSAPEAGVETEEVYALVTRVYGLDGHQPAGAVPGLAEGFAWPVVFDGAPQLLSLVRFEDGTHRLMAEADETIRAMAARALAAGGMA
ncbi:hypothetical protein LNKW23_25210 [Paralimibaculum aggregatum]|uniref:Uncharacterized protein n=1 Tax=Paralimibaculum aggregatum TaxID=3036245 RepID=A0ABQ6LPN6_9RHOB|nr:hypothetical protein [Limibaculum sp. NKW23]GMG83308.1 hypothetical protein LNKW23_25210 [Limibaculum sp. NKW23]